LPLLFIKIEGDSEVLVDMDETRESLIMTSNKEFSTMNENHLFEAMGYTQTNEEELSQMFSEDINNYLKKQVFYSDALSVSSTEMITEKKRN
jgi:hypothetical protein